MGTKRSSSAARQGSPAALLQSGIATTLDIRELKGVLVALANCPDEGFQRFRDECRIRLAPHNKSFFAEYSDDALREWREQLRMLWKPPRRSADVPPAARTMAAGPYHLAGEPGTLMDWWRAAIEHTALPWDINEGKVHVGTLQEEILNYWLRMAMQYSPPHQVGRRQKTFFIALWNKKFRALVPNGLSLPTILVHSFMLSADRLRCCRNNRCAAPYFVALRRDQLYCSSECAAPAKRAAKLKWWRREHASDRLPSLALKGGK
jgi:hypothetical protein